MNDSIRARKESTSANWDYVCDLAIVGSGGGAMCAALTAHSCSKRVLLLEKLDKVGGTTGYSGGMLWLPDNPVSKRAGLADSFELSRRYMDAVIGDAGPASSIARRDVFVRESPRMIDFLERQGMKFVYADGYADYYDTEPGGQVRGRSIYPPLFNIKELGDWANKLSIYDLNTVPVHSIDTFALGLIKRTWHGKWTALNLLGRIIADRLSGRNRRGMGAALQGRMLQLCLRAGIPVWTETAAESLIVENGRVAGVKVVQHGKSLRIKANNGVLLNSGGFARSQQMRDRYQRKPVSAQWTNVSPADTGEMMQAAIDLGAATALMEQAFWIPTSLHADGSFPYGAKGKDGKPMPFLQSYDIARPHGIVVDQSGLRYFNEAVSYMEQGNRMYERHRTVAAVPSWQIMDSRHRDRYPWAIAQPGRTPREWLDSGYMKKSQSLTDLARQCELDSQALTATVERFNGFARRGIDEDFHRGESGYARFISDRTHGPNPSLGSIERAPFYAVAIYPGDVGTSGGLLTDEFGRVVREDGGSIPGLYATGNTAASVMGRTYLGAGASNGPNYVWGWVAARHACGVSATPEPCRETSAISGSSRVSR
jgi:3-oxosteroid 1-dehydrogenase